MIVAYMRIDYPALNAINKGSNGWPGLFTFNVLATYPMLLFHCLESTAEDANPATSLWV